jgi:hypothetical protein
MRHRGFTLRELLVRIFFMMVIAGVLAHVST